MVLEPENNLRMEERFLVKEYPFLGYVSKSLTSLLIISINGKDQPSAFVREFRRVKKNEKLDTYFHL